MPLAAQRISEIRCQPPAAADALLAPSWPAAAHRQRLVELVFVRQRPDAVHRRRARTRAAACPASAAESRGGRVRVAGGQRVLESGERPPDARGIHWRSCAVAAGAAALGPQRRDRPEGDRRALLHAFRKDRQVAAARRGGRLERLRGLAQRVGAEVAGRAGDGVRVACRGIRVARVTAARRSATVFDWPSANRISMRCSDSNPMPRRARAPSTLMPSSARVRLAAGGGGWRRVGRAGRRSPVASRQPARVLADAGSPSTGSGLPATILAEAGSHRRSVAASAARSIGLVT